MLTLPIRERDETRRSLRFITSLSLSHYERGIRQLCHILFLRFSLSPIRERDETRRSLRFTSCPTGCGRGRNLKTRYVRFALAGFVEPSARVRSLAFETKRAPQGGSFCFKGERGIRTLGPVTDSGFRDRPIRPLWHLSEVCTI